MHNDAPNAHSPVCSTLHKMKVQLHDGGGDGGDGDGDMDNGGGDTGDDGGDGYDGDDGDDEVMGMTTVMIRKDYTLYPNRKFAF